MLKLVFVPKLEVSDIFPSFSVTFALELISVAKPVLVIGTYPLIFQLSNLIYYTQGIF